MTTTQVNPHLFIIFGATGNLTQNKLFPALYRLSTSGLLENKTKILGIARRKLNDHDYRALVRSSLQANAIPVNDQFFSSWCESCLSYHSIEDGNLDNYEELANRIKTIEQQFTLPGNRVFYMAIPPYILPKSIVRL
ncbi:MAG: hypothetical protein JSV20_02835, partial [Candidatus Bathyarchaeota archaeon]